MAHHADVWDDVWAEYDRRQRVPAAPATTPAAGPLPPRPSFAAERGCDHPAAPRRAGRRRRARRPWRLALGGAALLGGTWIGMPYATAVQIADAIGRGDGPGIARHVNWPALRAGVDAELDRARASVPGAGTDAYLSALAGDLAAGWTRPGAAADVLRARGATQGGLLRNLTLAGVTRMDVALARNASLRIEWRSFGWQVTAMDLAPPVPPVRLASLR